MAIRVQKQEFYGGEEYEESFYFFKRSVFYVTQLYLHGSSASSRKLQFRLVLWFIGRFACRF